MAGIYIHIPFCRQACLYCNFHFSTSLRLKNDLINALLKEIALRTVYNNDKTVETIYFGGGTPSLLPAEALNMILDALRRKFHIVPDAEITLEANPDDISGELLTSWKSMGINRLSIGIQSFFEEDLKWMNRAHTAEQSVNSIVLAQDAGFDNLTIDLIYGSPGLSDEKWRQNVKKAIDFNILHLSCYALTVEPKTALHSLIAKNKMQDTDPEQQARQFTKLAEWLEEAGYEHYEISNFSIPGKRSRHNTSYWQGKPYYGIGPSAHSFNGTDTRSWNIANNSLYIRSLLQNIIPSEKERLTTVQKLNEYIMTSLRTMEGIDLNHIQKQFGAAFRERLLVAAKPYSDSEKLIIQNNCVKLTNAGKLFADGIAAGLFEDKL
ncbi:radical SAM family heme chaperone HemW [Agriterribacter sp.]|uniref:radical SAM family heme chaperone HemW n=1 Tax=Agriterribacter sp. TaxID=2821509 RepID=UPI002CED6156|nr:radical SAM family heme chaperone HemW [Agriterribacter sp.]HRP55291.1 radical SAM family heme chaperone HemW [Agriterribacter sp.]